jgi:hypothetical protein
VRKSNQLVVRTCSKRISIRSPQRKETFYLVELQEQVGSFAFGFVENGKVLLKRERDRLLRRRFERHGSLAFRGV